MQDKDTTKSTFFQLVKPVNNSFFSQQLINLGVDKYAKKLKTIQLINLVAHAQLNQYKGLRDISNSLNNDKLVKEMHLNSISASQVSRRLRDLPPEVLHLILQSNIIEMLYVTGIGPQQAFTLNFAKQHH